MQSLATASDFFRQSDAAKRAMKDMELYEAQMESLARQANELNEALIALRDALGEYDASAQNILRSMKDIMGTLELYEPSGNKPASHPKVHGKQRTRKASV